MLKIIYSQIQKQYRMHLLWLLQITLSKFM